MSGSGQKAKTRVLSFKMDRAASLRWRSIDNRRLCVDGSWWLRLGMNAKEDRAASWTPAFEGLGEAPGCRNVERRSGGHQPGTLDRSGSTPARTPKSPCWALARAPHNAAFPFWEVNALPYDVQLLNPLHVYSVDRPVFDSTDRCKTCT